MDLLQRFRSNKAFSLIEMSMVLIIIATISGGMIAMSVSQSENANREQTQNKFKIIEKSLSTFISINKRLPCPADPALSENDANFGVERCNCNEFRGSISGSFPAPADYSCAAADSYSGGDVPFVTLGLPKQFASDGWGNKIFYSVSDAFTGTNAANCQIGTPETLFDFNECNKGLLKILDANGNVKTDDAAIVLLSFGPNAQGAYYKNIDSRVVPNPTSIESVNADLGDGRFTDKIVEKSDNETINFDDVILYRTKEQLLGNLNISISNGTCTIAEEILSSDDLFCGNNPGDANCAAYMSNLANHIKKLCL